MPGIFLSLVLQSRPTFLKNDSYLRQSLDTLLERTANGMLMFVQDCLTVPTFDQDDKP